MDDWPFRRKREPPRQPRNWREALQQVLYGMAVHGVATANLRTRMHLEHLLMFSVLGDMLGMPVVPPYHALRLLPHVLPELQGLRHRLYRERDFTDAMM